MSQFGAITVPAAAAVVFVESAQADDLQARVNAAIATILGGESPRLITAITLAGGGDGHTFVVAIESAPSGDVVGGLATPVAVVCYMASENEALAVARAAVSPGNSIIDEQIAGAAKGTRFMGMAVTSDTLPVVGPTGQTGPSGGPTGPTGPGVGSTGSTGPTGTAGVGSLAFGSFFALMPGDNAATIAVGAAVLFPQDGPASGIVRSTSSQFVLPATGIYQISWQVSVAEAGQLMLDINGSIATTASTVAGRATGTSQIMNDVMLSASAGDVLRVINPAGNAAALTLTPTAGGTHAVSAWLSIKRLS